MNSMSPVSQAIGCCGLTYPTAICRGISITALVLLVLASGTMSICGIVGYLPSLAASTGGGIFIASLISLVALAVCLKRAKPRNLQDGNGGGANPAPAGEGRGQNPQAPPPLANPPSTDGTQANLHNDLQASALAELPEYEDPRILDLVDAGRVEEAWKLYWSEDHLDSIPRGEKSAKPPERLVMGMIDLWFSKKIKIADRLGPDCVREWAMRYTRLRHLCLQEDQLWCCFNGYPEYIADLGKQHPFFAVQVMISKRGEGILGDIYRLEIFRAGLSYFLSKIQNHNLTDDEFKYFANFLIGYQLVIHKDDFDKIKQVTQAVQQQKALSHPDSEAGKKYALWVVIMDLVEGKLSFQGIYGEERGFTYFPPVDAGLVRNIFTLEWIEKVTRKLSQATEEEGILKGLLYLSLIPQNSTHYSEAQMMLGNVWMELENYEEAGQHFLQVAKLNDPLRGPDALMLASTCLLAAVKEGDSWAFVSRGKMQELSDPVRTLNPQEAKLFTVEKLQALLLPPQANKQ